MGKMQGPLGVRCAKWGGQGGTPTKVGVHPPLTPRGAGSRVSAVPLVSGVSIRQHKEIGTRRRAREGVGTTFAIKAAQVLSHIGYSARAHMRQTPLLHPATCDSST